MISWACTGAENTPSATAAISGRDIARMNGVCFIGTMNLLDLPPSANHKLIDA
jgi:hypothetical protein